MKVIAVDDEFAARALLVDAIEEAVPDVELASFEYPEDALEYAENNPVDVAFLDIQMPGMLGIELAKRLKGINPKINVIFVTGYDQYAMQAVALHASGYVQKPVTADRVKVEIDNLLYPIDETQQGCFAKTFGHFEFFVDGKALSFPRSKSKELLAVLIDREGAALSTEQMAAVLYEDRNYDRSLKNTMMPIIRCLQTTLEEAGVGDVLVKSWGHLAVDKTKFTCDAYDYIKGEPYALNLFKGEYMTNYSWGEERVGIFYWMN